MILESRLGLVSYSQHESLNVLPVSLVSCLDKNAGQIGSGFTGPQESLREGLIQLKSRLGRRVKWFSRIEATFQK